jgi:hypothetical protein
VLDDLTFEKKKIIFSDISACDPSIIFFNNKFWLFFSLTEEMDGKLYLACADELFGEWRMHKKNPIKVGELRVRMAGEIFIYNENLYRPSQNCVKSYGASVIINKIIRLDEEDFAEMEEKEILPNQCSQYPDGLHTISSLGKNLTLIDGKKTKFSPLKPIFSALFKIRANFIVACKK